MQRRGPTGHLIQAFGVWEIRRCVYCGTEAPRWKPGIRTRTQLEAIDLDRPASNEELLRNMDRSLKLAALERLHLGVMD